MERVCSDSGLGASVTPRLVASTVLAQCLRPWGHPGMPPGPAHHVAPLVHKKGGSWNAAWVQSSLAVGMQSLCGRQGPTHRWLRHSARTMPPARELVNLLGILSDTVHTNSAYTSMWTPWEKNKEVGLLRTLSDTLGRDWAYTLMWTPHCLLQ